MATVTNGMKAQRGRFNEGFGTFHQEEIEVGKVLLEAALLVYGREKTKRLLKRCPAKVFKPLRYGRRLLGDPAKPNDAFACVMIDLDPYFTGKAGNEHILVPGCRGWRAFCSRVLSISMRPRWADGLTATAEALDDLGYAIAESIAAIRAFGITSDDEIAFTLKR